MIWWWFDYAEHFWFGSDWERPRPAPEPRPDATVISLADERAKRRRAAMRAL